MNLHYFVSLYTIFISPPCSCKFLRYYVSNLISWINIMKNICKWFQFNGQNSFLINSFYFSTNYIFLRMFFSFTIPYLHSYYMIFKECFVLVVFPSFPLPLLFLSPFSLFSFCSFFLSLFSSFFSCSQVASFPQYGLPFPKSAAPVLPHFLLPWHRMIYMCRWHFQARGLSVTCHTKILSL